MPGDDGVAVTVDNGGEVVEAGQVVLADGVEPLGKNLVNGEMIKSLSVDRR